MRRLRFNGTGSGGGGCPGVHEDLDTGEVVVHGTPVSDPADLAQLQHFDDGEVAVVVPRNTLVDFGPRDETPRLINADDEFNRLFETFKHTAWRLETRRRYASDETTEEWAQFAAGQHIEWDYDDAWCRNVRRQTEGGKRFERVRLVDRPATPGQSYLRSNAVRNCAVGEDIRNLSRADAQRLRLPDEDFWLFDSRLVARLLFDKDDGLRGAELITEPAAVNRYCQVRDAAWHYAVPYEEFKLDE
ncbi:DUF6879 family protein [Streptomyces uncialis]|uniref:DUF6879 family protein n=1 Tax=Streptomyces uncialis TaxID=1048205 RepID=UPI00386579CF|nr:hypothetical protein OG268_26065 [Streptomyces uncialis]